MNEQIEHAAQEHADKHFLQDVQIFFNKPYDKAKERYAKTLADFAKWCMSKQWISVDERLPSEDAEVLCMMKSNGAIVSGFIFRNEKGSPQVATSPDFHFEDYGGYEPTHWLPIPPLNTEKDNL